MRDARALRALANPVRLDLLALLRQNGPRTVGQLSELVGAAPGSVSYHLSTLERSGLVERAPDLARDGRETWWRASHHMTRYEQSEFLGDPESAAAALAMRRTVLQRLLAEQLAYLEVEPALPADWIDAATSGDTMEYLTADELRALSADLEALAARWRRPLDPPRPGTEPVRLIFAAFRRP